jgi:hypothetical protein
MENLIIIIDDKIRLLEFWEEAAEDSNGAFSTLRFLGPLEFFEYAKANSVAKAICVVVDRFGPGYDNQGDFIEPLKRTDFKGKKILTSAIFKHGETVAVEGFDYVFSKKDIVENVRKFLNV